VIKMVYRRLEELKDAIKRWLRGYHEYLVRIDLTIPAGTTLTLEFAPPADEVWFKEDYKFKVDKLDVIKMSYYADGEVIFKDLLIGENELEMPNLETLTVRNAVIVIENTDTVDHTGSILEKYLVIPKSEFDKLVREAEKEEVWLWLHQK